MVTKRSLSKVDQKKGHLKKVNLTFEKKRYYLDDENGLCPQGNQDPRSTILDPEDPSITD